MAEVYIPIPVATVTEAAEKPSLTYRLDLEAGRIVGKVDGLEAVNQAIRKAIITPRFKCLIYDNQYGSAFEEAIVAKDATIGYIEAAAEGFVKDALAPDTRILSVRNIRVELAGDGLQLSFTANTIYGETTIEEVI